MADAQAWGEVGRRYAIHKETFSFFKRLKSLGLKGWKDGASPEDLRAMALRRAEVFAGAADFEGSEKEFVVPCDGNPEGVRVSVYKPLETASVPAILVYFHGGGMVYCSRNTHATTLKIIASRASCVVVNVEFRQASEHKLPAAFHDCLAATQWVLTNKLQIGATEDSCVGVGGDSCGGQLAASLAHDVKGLHFQILVYPVTDLTMSCASYKEFSNTPGQNKEGMEWIIFQFMAKEGQWKDPLLSPIFRSSFQNLPPALVILAELDPLRDEGLAYSERLKTSGVAVESLIVKGAPHTFFALPAHFRELTKVPYSMVVDFIRKFQN